MPFPYLQVGGARQVGAAGVPVVAGVNHDLARRRPAPWRYDPDPSCIAPRCLPSYWRPVYPPLPPAGPRLPVAAVVERLAKLDYRAYAVTLAGPNYWIEALDRFDRALLLIVNARNGMIRRTLP